MTAYLDYNIYVDIESGDNKTSNILQLDGNISSFPFSPIHIFETDNIEHPDIIKKDKFIKDRLQTISKVSKNYCIQPVGENIKFKQEEPFEVLMRIRSHPIVKTATNTFTNLITEEQKNSLRDLLGVKTAQLNNYKPDEAIYHLSQKLTNWGTQMNFLELIEYGIKSHPNGATFGLNERIAAIYELLDLMGYWKDKLTPTSNVARMHDAEHAFYAAHCNYFISDDKRSRNKAKVAYLIFDIKTKVLSSCGE